MTEKNLIKADFYTSIVLMAFGIAVTVMAGQMPVIRYAHSAPGLIPRIIGSAITVLSFTMFLRSIIKTKGRVGVSGASFKAFFADNTTHRIVITVVLCVAYALSFGKLFFPLLTFLYIFTFIIIFEYDRGIPLKARIKKLILAAIVAICSSVSIFVLFQYLFLVRLP